MTLHTENRNQLVHCILNVVSFFLKHSMNYTAFSECSMEVSQGHLLQKRIRKIWVVFNKVTDISSRSTTSDLRMDRCQGSEIDNTVNLVKVQVLLLFLALLRSQIYVCSPQPHSGGNKKFKAQHSSKSIFFRQCYLLMPSAESLMSLVFVAIKFLVHKTFIAR